MFYVLTVHIDYTVFKRVNISSYLQLQITNFSIELKCCRLPVTAASKKAFPPPIEFEEEQTEAMNLSSTPSAPKSSLSPVAVSAASPPTTLPPSKSPAHSHNPPIVLRIFKGTAQLVTPVEEPTPTPAPPAAVTPERKSRRRGHSTEIAGNVSPKRLRERHKGVSYTETDPDSEPDYETLSAPTTATYSKSRSERATRSNSYSAPPGKVSEPITEQVPESIPESTHNLSDVIHEQTEEAETVEDISKQVENSAKIEEGENLLASTYVDFNAAEKKILGVKTNSSNDVEREELLAVLGGNDCDEQPKLSSNEKAEHGQLKQTEIAETEWFSDSECSDTAVEQMNTVNDNDLASRSSNEAQQATKTPKKRSIFKSRQVGGDSNAPGTKKRFGLYKHKWSDSDGPPGAATPTQTRPEPTQVTNTLEEDFDEVEPLTRVTSYPEPDADSMDGELVTSIKCTKKAKGVSTYGYFLQKGLHK